MGPWSIVSWAPDHCVLQTCSVSTVSLIFSQISVRLCVKLMSKWIRTEPNKQWIRNGWLLSLGELTNSRPTAEAPAWDRTRCPLHVGHSCVAWSVWGASGCGTRIYPWCTSWLFGAHSLGWNALLSLDIAGRDLVLPQLTLPGFSGSPWEAIPFLRSERGVGGLGRKKVGKQEEGKEGEVWFVCKMNM